MKKLFLLFFAIILITSVTSAQKVYSVDYIFKKIKNIDGKCKQLLKYNDVLLVASNKGLYEIKGKESKQILKKEYVNCIQPSSFGGVFYIGTDKGITAIKRQNRNILPFYYAVLL